MKSLWNMLNKEFTIEGAVSAFLVINIIAWTLITMGVGCWFVSSLDSRLAVT